MPNSHKQPSDNLPGLIAAYTSPFVVLSTLLLMTWLVLNGLISILWVSVLGGITGVGLILNLARLYRSVLGGPIAREGCLIGLYVYWTSWVPWAVLIWQAGLNGALIGIVLIPIACFGAALFITARATPRRKRVARRRR